MPEDVNVQYDNEIENLKKHVLSLNEKLDALADKINSIVEDAPADGSYYVRGGKAWHKL